MSLSLSIWGQPCRCVSWIAQYEKAIRLKRFGCFTLYVYTVITSMLCDMHFQEKRNYAKWNSKQYSKFWMFKRKTSELLYEWADFNFPQLAWNLRSFLSSMWCQNSQKNSNKQELCRPIQFPLFSQKPVLNLLFSSSWKKGRKKEKKFKWNVCKGKINNNYLFVMFVHSFWEENWN